MYPEAPPAGSVPGCGENGVLGALPGVMGALQATEVLKILLGIGEPLSRHLLYFDALRMDFQRLGIARSASCAVCGEHPSILRLEDAAPAPVAEIGAGELAEILGSVLLLDVREANEVAVNRIGGSLHIPLRELDSRFGTLDPAREVVVYCKGGVRSAEAARILGAKGFRVRSLRGGILAWIREVDPGLPTY